MESGWIRLSIPGTGRNGGWAQVPPSFAADTIPDEYIFDSEWNRERVNIAWQEHEDSDERQGVDDD